MKIKLPNLKEKEQYKEQYIEDKSSVILIGANGSGKTRMSIWIEENNQDINIHRISAQKSLNFSDIISPTEMEKAKEEFWYGIVSDDKEWLKKYGKNSYRWGNNPEIHLLNDFDKLMQYLMTENYEKSIQYREQHKEGNREFDNSTKLEEIKKIWENVILHRKLKICAGKIEATNIDEETYYNGNKMSDGERAIFYFIGEVLCAKENSLIIIDEPENHLHKSILIRLWNAIESVRDDCMFVYITHNLEFASSRVNSQIIWVKNFLSENNWDYELIESIDASDSLKLEIMGNRQKILLIEGTPTKSIDKKLYSKIYHEYNILTMESCNTVIQVTKTYNQTKPLHYMEVKGIIDRDRRGEKEIGSLKAKNIFVPEVAEIENLFLLPEVIKIVAEKQDKNEVEQIISEVKEKIIEFLTEKIKEQALLFTKQRSQNDIIQKMNKKTLSFEEYKLNLNNLVSVEDIESIYKEEINRLKKIIDDKNYLEALKVINNKGLLTYTGLPNKFGWKKDYYIDYVLLLLEKNNKISNNLKQIFKKYISNDI